MRRYFRLSGGGNDFLALVEPPEEPDGDRIRAWCRRGLSAGADGLFVLERRPGGARMRYFNADGRAADLCLNGTRCAVRLASHLGWVEDAAKIETGAGVIEGRCGSSGSVALTLPRPETPQARSLELDGRTFSGWTVGVGVPHFVLTWAEGLADAPVGTLGPKLRSHPDLAPAGANIHFVNFTSRHRFEIRSFERGVEAETLACGSGVLAAAATGLDLDRLELPAAALTLGGFELRVEAAQDEASWCLIGDARLIAEGTLLEDADLVPDPPPWT